jgi:peptidoglycan/LPS O-acetylase OafA/YrhL
VRNRYLDLLRAAAIVRVVVYHLLGWPWLSILLPSMGVMFALAGSLTAASLQKRGAGTVIVSRLRRLLPPLWLLALIAVPGMLIAGWAHEQGQTPFSAAHLVFWILPIGDPPGSDRAADLWEPLWYIRAYLWFILLSPLMYFAYKKTGWFAIVTPILLIGVLDKTGFGLPGVADAAMWDFVTFAACWMAGFAHRDGRLARVEPSLTVIAALVLGAAAMYWIHLHPDEGGYDLNNIPEAQALWSLAFVLVVLRWQPSMDWLRRARPLDRLVTLLNNRAVTIYLWHNIAITMVWPLLGLIALDDVGDGLNDPVDLVAALALTAVAVLAFGWLEDVAARRRPRLWPWTDRPGRAPVARTAGPTALEAAWAGRHGYSGWAGAVGATSAVDTTGAVGATSAVGPVGALEAPTAAFAAQKPRAELMTEPAPTPALTEPTAALTKPKPTAAVTTPTAALAVPPVRKAVDPESADGGYAPAISWFGGA